MSSLRRRRLVVVLIMLFFVALSTYATELPLPEVEIYQQPPSVQLARKQLLTLAVKGRAPKTGYSRQQFGGGWETTFGCDTRNRILNRDLRRPVIDGSCKVQSGTLIDPYTGEIMQFQRGVDTSDDVQIDHVVALSNAWQTGAQQLNYHERVELSNDPLNLLAVDGKANEEKSNSDAASWLPANKAFRCSYVSRQVAVKHKHLLWVTAAEYAAMDSILRRCSR